MPIDSQKLSQQKEKILSFIRIHGPSLPVQIGRAIGASTLFASAFLSELFAERKIKMSNMKVGSSPLYFLPGQESLLERFANHLNQREREALQILKNELVLEDESLPPVMRVAIRSLKDFAVPLRARINEDVKTIWKYFIVEDSNIKQILNEKIFSKDLPKKENSIPSSQAIETKPLELKTELQPVQGEIPKETIPLENTITPAIKEEKSVPVKAETKKKQKKPKDEKQHKFPLEIEEFLKAKDIEILSTIDKKSREVTAKIRIDTLFGKQEFFMIAKDKKKIVETDLALALQKAQSEKMTALIVSPGEIDKKALPYIREWRNLVKFEKLKV